MSKKVALTPATIDDLQSGKLADLFTPGLFIEVLASGKKRWLYPSACSAANGAEMSQNASEKPEGPKLVTLARRFLIEGHVQRVFFREWIVTKAREMGITGWVRNLSDGRVEVYAIADKSVLDQFARHLHKGSPASIVEKVQSATADVEAVNGFTRRQTG